jgi:hypothetical protein
MAVAGKRFAINMAEHSQEYAGTTLTFEVTGLPMGSGLLFKKESVSIAGVPNGKDCANSPIVAIVTGYNNIYGVRAQSVAFIRVQKCEFDITRRMGEPTIEIESAGNYRMGSPTSAKTCVELDWLVPATGLQVCRQSRIRPLGSNPKAGVMGCAEEITQGGADDLCERSGARLCAAEELERGVGKDDECTLADAWVWSETPCINEIGVGGVYVVLGSGSSKRCVAPSSTEHFAGICCGDFLEGTLFAYKGAEFEASDTITDRFSTMISWLWPAYPRSQVELREVGGRWAPSSVVTVPNYGQLQTAQGDDDAVDTVPAFVLAPTSFMFGQLALGTTYEARITPTQDGRNRDRQAVVVPFRTPTMFNMR